MKKTDSAEVNGFVKKKDLEPETLPFTLFPLLELGFSAGLEPTQTRALPTYISLHGAAFFEAVPDPHALWTPSRGPGCQDSPDPDAHTVPTVGAGLGWAPSKDWSDYSAKGQG